MLHKMIAPIGLALGLGLAVPMPSAQAHGGGLDANGCHNDRKRGDYHCHRAPVTRARAQPARAQSALSLNRTYFPNCAAAREAGAAPLRRGDPGYRPALDRDNDGIACE